MVAWWVKEIQLSNIYQLNIFFYDWVASYPHINIFCLLIILIPSKGRNSVPGFVTEREHCPSNIWFTMRMGRVNDRFGEACMPCSRSKGPSCIQ